MASIIPLKKLAVFPQKLFTDYFRIRFGVLHFPSSVWLIFTSQISWNVLDVSISNGDYPEAISWPLQPWCWDFVPLTQHLLVKSLVSVLCNKPSWPWATPP